MGKHFVIIGATGKKSGGAFAYAPRIFGDGIKAEVQEYLGMQKE